jgi:hypothetical protein
MNKKTNKKSSLEEAKLLIKKKGKYLEKQTERNINTKHINYKLMYLLHDPFTYINAYTKISKNKGALSKGYEDEEPMKFFGQEAAERIAERVKKSNYKFKPVKKTKYNTWSHCAFIEIKNQR